jgi:arylsulfatase A-like enzyme
MPTIAKLVEAELLKDRKIDGKDIWPLISGTEGAVSPHEIYYYYKGNRLESARQGKWKIRRSGKKSQSVELYDLDSDISETKNLTKENEALVQAMIKKMNLFDEDLKKSQRPAGKL